MRVTTVTTVVTPPLVLLAAMLGIFAYAGYGYPWAFIAGVCGVTFAASVTALVVERIEVRS